MELAQTLGTLTRKNYHVQKSLQSLEGMCTIAKVSWYTADPMISFSVGGALDLGMITLHRDQYTVSNWLLVFARMWTINQRRASLKSYFITKLGGVEELSARMRTVNANC